MAILDWQNAQSPPSSASWEVAHVDSCEGNIDDIHEKAATWPKANQVGLAQDVLGSSSATLRSKGSVDEEPAPHVDVITTGAGAVPRDANPSGGWTSAGFLRHRKQAGGGLLRARQAPDQ